MFLFKWVDFHNSDQMGIDEIQDIGFGVGCGHIVTLAINT